MLDNAYVPPQVNHACSPTPHASFQVKAFRFIGCAPRRPFRLTSRARRDACCRLVGGTPLVSPPDGRDRGTTETGRKGRDGKCEGQREKRTNTGVGEEDIQSAREGWTDDEDREAASAEGIVGRKISCGMCGALLAPEDVSFRMTTKMVRETLFHVRTSPNVIIHHTTSEIGNRWLAGRIHMR